MGVEAPTQLFPREAFDVQAAMANWTATRRKLANRFLDAYETTVDQLADAHVNAARTVDHPGVVKLAETQATVSREMAGAYVNTARKLLDD